MTHIWKTFHVTCFHESEKGTLRVECLAQEQNIMVRASRPDYEQGKWNVGKVKAKSIHWLHLWDNTIIIMMMIIIIVIIIIRLITIIVIQFI